MQVISGFNLKRVKNIARWRCATKTSKTNLKSMISPLLTCPQVCLGCQKIGKTKLKTTLVSWSAKIWPKFNKIQKTFRKQGFVDNFCSILMVFHSFFNFGSNSPEWTSVWWSGFFDTSDTPGGFSSLVEWNEFWSFRWLWNCNSART